MKSVRKATTMIYKMNMQAQELPVKMVFNLTSAAQNLGAVTKMEIQSLLLLIGLACMRLALAGAAALELPSTTCS
jgi:hypothetical protein